MKLVLYILGVAFIVFGVFYIIKQNSEKAYYATTLAVIDEIVDESEISYELIEGKINVKEGDKYVYITYEVDGKKYEHVLYNSYSSTMKEGDVITITYDTRKPGNLFSGSYSMLLFIASIVGGVISLIFAISLSVNKTKDNKKLYKKRK